MGFFLSKPSNFFVSTADDTELLLSEQVVGESPSQSGQEINSFSREWKGWLLWGVAASGIADLMVFLMGGASNQDDKAEQHDAIFYARASHIALSAFVVMLVLLYQACTAEDEIRPEYTENQEKLLDTVKNVKAILGTCEFYIHRLDQLDSTVEEKSTAGNTKVADAYPNFTRNYYQDAQKFRGLSGEFDQLYSQLFSEQTNEITDIESGGNSATVGIAASQPALDTLKSETVSLAKKLRDEYSGRVSENNCLKFPSFGNFFKYFSLAVPEDMRLGDFSNPRLGNGQ